MSYGVNGSHPVSFDIHAGRLSELGLQPSDLLLELVSLMLTFNSLFLFASDKIKMVFKTHVKSSEKRFENEKIKLPL